MFSSMLSAVAFDKISHKNANSLSYKKTPTRVNILRVYIMSSICLFREVIIYKKKAHGGQARAIRSANGTDLKCQRVAFVHGNFHPVHVELCLSLSRINQIHLWAAKINLCNSNLQICVDLLISRKLNMILSALFLLATSWIQLNIVYKFF